LAIRDGALLEFAYATGARVSELVGLKLQDVLYEDGLARIFGKGSKERIVPVGRRALGAVALYAREIRPRLDKGKGRGLVFLNARGTPLSRGPGHHAAVHARRPRLPADRAQDVSSPRLTLPCRGRS